jgi:drug/metabolite transporter (DMT)-like permease
MAAGPHLMGHGLLNWSVRRLPAFTVNMAVLGEPVLATLYAALLFGEVPGAAFYAGAALIGAGIVLATTQEREVPAGPSL